jgi:glucose-1-phosphate thymidylyltransferase
MRAVIPVAGFGSRLRPHTHSLPKVLLNVAGKPILAHILDELVLQKIDKVTIITGYKGDLIENYVNDNYSFDATFVEQKELLGLGHAIWTATPTFEDEPLMIILGDTIFDADLSLASKKGLSSIGVKYVDDPRRFGVVINDENGNIKKLVEKPKEPISNLAIVGIYYINNGLKLKSSLDKIINENIKTNNEFQLTDALQIMLEEGEEFVTFPVDGWHDCGKKETMLSTNQFLLEKYNNKYQLDTCVVINPSYISNGAKVSNCVIGPYASIADGCIVNNSIIRDSILSENANVNNISLDKSIIGNNAIVEGKSTELNLGSNSEITL